MPQNTELAQLPLNSAGSAYDPTRPLTQQDLREYQWRTASLNLRSGMTGYLSGSKGYFIGFSKGVSGVTDGTPVFSVGNPTGNYVAWNGATLKVVGDVTVTGGIVSGSLTVSSTGSISAGMTAYDTGTGFWLDGSGKVAVGVSTGSHYTFDSVNGLQIYNASGTLIFDSNTLQYAGNSTEVTLTIGSTADTNGNYLQSGSTSVLVDDAGLGNTATYGQVSSLPTTLSGYGITDGQTMLPNASGIQILERNSGGTLYFADKYGNELNCGSTRQQTNFTTASTSYVQVGSTLVLPNPGTSVGVLASFSAMARMNAGGSATTIAGYLQISLDGGSSWTSNPNGLVVYPTYSGTAEFMFFGGNEFTTGTATGDIWVKVWAKSGDSSITVELAHPTLSAIVIPNANYSVLAGALSSTIPSAATGNCTVYYPTTTCTAYTSITCTPNGGTGGYTYAWTKVSGGGTITSSFNQTCVVYDTETATPSGATATTTVNCTVTDSSSSTATSGNCVVTDTFTLLYNPIVVSVPTTASSTCYTANPGTCTASVNVSASVAGGNGVYSHSWTRVSGSTFTLTNTTTSTVTASSTQNTTKPATAYTETIRDTVTDTESPAASGHADCAVTLNFKSFN